jgi:hypothetical protein
MQRGLGRCALRCRWTEQHSLSAAPVAGKAMRPWRSQPARACWGVVLAGLAAVMLLPARPLAQQRPVITTPARILALPSARTPLAIAVGPEEGLPHNAYLRMRGLPQAVALSEGHAIAPGVWAVPLSGLPVLAAIVPTGAQGTSEIIVDLLSLDGKVLAQTKTTLVITAVSQPPGAAASAASSPPVSPPASPQVGSAALASPSQADAPNRGDRERALSFYGKGLELLQRGDIDAARKFFERAADLGLSQGAMALATSYDPNELAKLKVVGLQANAAAARKWYNRAAELGAAEAGERLRRLGAR